MSPRHFIARTWIGFVFTFFAITAQAQAQSGTGALSGTVANSATGNLLEGVKVQLPQLNRTVLSDNTGRYILNDVPAGNHELVVSYLGLDTARETVTVAPGGPTIRNITLTTDIYQMEKISVSGEREGNALALTAQRNASNLKNVVALDAYGNLPNMSAGELAVRLPGVASQFDDEGNVTGVIVRGSASTMNRVTVDGNLMSNTGGFNRQFQTHSLTGAMFEQLEVIKGQTPDQTADSVGGTINLKTRSPLSMQEKRRVSYSFGSRWAPPFYDHISQRRDQPIHPQVNFAYQEVFDVLGGDRNLGVALNVFYSENVNAPTSLQYDYQNTAGAPAYLWDFRTQNQINNRTQKSVNLKAEYRLTDRTKLVMNAIYNDAFEKSDRLYTTRAFSNQTVATLDANGQPTGTGAIVPGYTDTRTEVRAVAGSNFEMSTFYRRFLNRTRLLSLGVEHELDRWKIDYDTSYSQTHNNLAHEPGGNLVARVANVGWIVDTTDAENPVFTQTSGPSIYDIANYRSAVSLNTRNDGRDVEVLTVKGNAAYTLPVMIASSIKTGLFYREQKFAELGNRRRWNYVGTGALPASYPEVYAFPGAGLLPYVDPLQIYADTTNPALWTEDRYFNAADRFTNTRNASEEVIAAYVQGQAKVSKLTMLAGLRGEKTDVSGFGYIRVAPATAAQIPDPVARAEYDWNNPVTNKGDYTRSFPSVHATYEFNDKLRAQASWSTSFGRPAVTNLVPSATINDTEQTVTIGNPALGPQYAKNVDLSLQYYIAPAGLVSVGYFTKDITDYILTQAIGVIGAGTDNGYEGSYSGYTLRSSRNAGTATVKGWEFDYRQQLVFLPGLLRGLSVSANFTILQAEGDFGGATILRDKDVSGFIPKTANAGISYSHGRFGFNVLANYTGDYLNTDATTAQRRIYRKARTIVNTGVSFQFKPSVTFFCDLSNAFNEPQSTYRYIESRAERVIYTGQTITFGVSGRF